MGHRRIRTILTIIRVGTRAWVWHWVPASHGARTGGITGEIAIGATVTSTLTTTTISIATTGTTTIGPVRAVIDLVRVVTAPAPAIGLPRCQPTENGDTIRHIAATRRTVIGERMINLARATADRVIVHRNSRPAATDQARVIDQRPVRLAEIVHRLVRLVAVDRAGVPARQIVHRRDHPEAAAEIE